jgi:acetylglutamate kinase
VGYVDPTVINISALKMFIESGITPVMCAITHDANGSLLNTNADTIASSIAQALAVEYSVKLIYCFEKNGVLADKDNDNSVINLITRESFASLLADGVVEGGMIPKLENAFSAIDNGVSEVIIKHAKNLNINIQTTIK